MRCTFVAVLIPVILLLTACESPTGTDDSARLLKTELVRVPGSQAQTAPASVHARTASVDAYDAWVTNDVILHSLKLSIYQIWLVEEESGDQHGVYSCSGPDCFIDLAAGEDFEDLLNAGTTHALPDGSYKTVSFSVCEAPDAENHTVYISAEADVDGVRYYTKADGTVSTVGPAEDMPYTMGGCAYSSYQPNPLVLNDSSFVTEDGNTIEETTVTLRLAYDLTNMVWAGTSPADWGAGEIGICHTESGLNTPGPFVCSSYAQVVAVQSTENPIVERYIVEATGPDGTGDEYLLVVYFTPDDEPLMVSSRRHYTGAWNHPDAYKAFLNLDSEFDLFEDNGDGTYRLGNHDFDAVIPNFRRESHTGVARGFRWNESSKAVPASIEYTATRID